MSSRPSVPVLAAILALAGLAGAEEGLDVEGFVQMVLRSHPAARVSAGLAESARAESQAARQFPDPSIQYSRGRATANHVRGVRATESGISVTQTIPWPGSRSAGVRAGDRAADGLRAESTATLWEVEIAARRAFARLLTARALVEIDQSTEEDARSLRDLVARRTELGETREADRIRSMVEWMRQRRLVDASRREAEAAEALVRTLAGEALPRPLMVQGRTRGEIAPQDRDVLAARLTEGNPQLLAARASAERQSALVSQAKRARVPDLDLTVFRDEELDKASNGVALALRIPLWNANRGEIARNTAAASVALAETERRRLDLLAQLDDRLRDLDVAGAQVQSLEKEILPSAADSLRLARRSYEEGETSLLDLLDTQRTFRETQREAAESRSALALAITDIQRLVGPDFDPWRKQ